MPNAVVFVQYSLFYGCLPSSGVPEFLEPFGQVDDMEKAFCFRPDAMDEEELAAFPQYARLVSSIFSVVTPKGIYRIGREHFRCRRLCERYLQHCDSL